MAAFADVKRKTVTPKDGDRIDVLLRRAGLDPAVYSEPFIRINKTRLGKDNQLLLGVKYSLPEKSDLPANPTPPKPKKYQIVPIFGKAYEHVDYVDDKLKGATYYLVSGHGGPDPGAQTNYGEAVLSEDEYAYDVILRLARYLISHQALVHVVIRDPDDGIRDDAVLANDDHETCLGAEIPLDQVQRLGQRADSIDGLYKTERKGYCRSVFIHIDSRSKDERIDIFFYHFMKSVRGERLANILRDKMEQKYKKHQSNRGFTGTVKERNLYVLRETNPVGVFLELGNLQNSLDRQRFLIAKNREAMARWISEGLIEDYRLEKKQRK